MREIAIPEEWSAQVCVVDDVTEQDLAQYLTSDELARAASFRSDRRRQEWAAARIAARVLAIRHGMVEHPLELIIDVRESCPFASAGSTEWALSLTHSGLAGAAALGQGRIGVDLERPRRVDPATVRFFLNEDEIEAFRSCIGLDEPVVHFWSAKEAAFKAAPRARLLRQVRFSEIEVSAEGIFSRWDDGEATGSVKTRILPQGSVLSLARA